MNIMTKRGSLDNNITYEHYCDTKADLANIPKEQITLGSVAIVLKDENNEMGIYIADSNKEWNSFSSGGSSAEEIELEELTITENGSYSAGAGKGFSKVEVEVEGEQLDDNDTVCRLPNGAMYFDGMLTRSQNDSDEKVSAFMFNVSHVRLGSNVKEISGNAMKGSKSLVSIQGESVTTVWQGGFAGCTALQNVDFPNITEVRDGAFSGCNSLVHFNFGKMRYIGNGAFGGCTKLVSPVIVGISPANNGLSGIEKNAFAGCSSIKEVYLTNTSVETNAFNSCSGIKKLSVKVTENPTSNVIIYPVAFGGCTGLEKAIIDINGDIKYTYGNYSSGAFGGCTHLADLYLGSHISNIEAGSFGGVPITCKVRCGFSEGSISGFPENAGFAGNIENLDIEYDVPYPDEDAFFAD